MDIPYATSSFSRTRGDFPELSVVNMLPEAVAVDGPSPALLSRPGLSASDVSMGVGPIRHLFQSDGILSGLLYGVSDDTLYEAGTGVGTVTGEGEPSIAGYDNFLFIAAGASLHGYDGAFSTITFPDSADVTKVVVGASRGIALRADSQRFYWTEPLGTTFDDLAFASAEYSPDGLLDALFWNDSLILFGTKTVEFWSVSGDPDIPFAPMQGRVFQTGIRGTGAATLLGSSYAWVTEKNTVCVNTPELVVSYPGLEVKISESSGVSLWTFVFEGTEYLALTLDTETWVLHPRENSSWVRFETYGSTNFLGTCFAGGVFGSLDGTCYEFSDTCLDGAEQIEKSFTAWVPINDDFINLHRLVMRANTGTTRHLTGDYVNPTVGLRFSKDGGKSWSPWYQRGLGEQGDYTFFPTWNSLGKFSYPGALLEIRVSDPVSFRVSGLIMPEKG